MPKKIAPNLRGVGHLSAAASCDHLVCIKRYYFHVPVIRFYPPPFSIRFLFWLHEFASFKSLLVFPFSIFALNYSHVINVKIIFGTITRGGWEPPVKAIVLLVAVPMTTTFCDAFYGNWMLSEFFCRRKGSSKRVDYLSCFEKRLGTLDEFWNFHEIEPASLPPGRTITESPNEKFWIF